MILNASRWCSQCSACWRKRRAVETGAIRRPGARQCSCRFREHDLSQVLGVMRACHAPEQPMHAIVIRVIKRAKAVRFACRFGSHVQSLQSIECAALRFIKLAAQARRAFTRRLFPINLIEISSWGSESIYKTNGSRSIGVYEVVPVAGQAQRLLGRPRASCIMLN